MSWGDVSDPARIRHGRLVVVGVAVVGLAVLVGVLVSVAGSPTSTATQTAVVAVQPVAGRVATSPAEVATVVVGLAETGPVLDAAAAGAGVSRDAAQDDVEVAAAGAGIVTVTADGASNELAAGLATSTTDALAAALVRSTDRALQQSLGPLGRQLQELSTALQAVPLGDPRRASLEQNYGAIAGVIADRTAAPAPRLLPDGAPIVSASRAPLGEAVLVVLAVGVLAAVAAGAWRLAQRPARRDPDVTLAGVDGPYAVLHPGDDAPAVLTRLYADAVRGDGPVLVLQLSDPGALDVGRELVGSAEIMGDRVEHTDLTPGVPRDPAPPSATGTGRRTRTSLALSSLRRPRVDGTAVGTLRASGVHAAVVAVDTHRALSARLADAVYTLEGLGVELRGVVVWRGRFPDAPPPPAPSSPVTPTDDAPTPAVAPS